MKFLPIPLAFFCAAFLSSCSLASSLIQIPARTLQSVGRTAGFGLEQSEVLESEKEQSEIVFEKVERR